MGVDGVEWEQNSVLSRPLPPAHHLQSLLQLFHTVLHHTHPQNTVEKEKGQTHTHKTKWLLAITCPEDQRLKQAYCDSDCFQVSPFGVL